MPHHLFVCHTACQHAVWHHQHATPPLCMPHHLTSALSSPAYATPPHLCLVITCMPHHLTSAFSSPVCHTTRTSSQADKLRTSTVQHVKTAVHDLCAARGVSCSIAQNHDAPAILSDSALVQVCACTRTHRDTHTKSLSLTRLLSLSLSLSLSLTHTHTHTHTHRHCAALAAVLLP